MREMKACITFFPNDSAEKLIVSIIDFMLCFKETKSNKNFLTNKIRQYNELHSKISFQRARDNNIYGNSKQARRY